MVDSVNSQDEQFRPSPEALRLVEWNCVRVRRNQLLRETDYTQTLDSPLSDEKRAQVAAYRQALRDVPQDVGDPFSVVWPDMPDFLK